MDSARIPCPCPDAPERSGRTPWLPARLLLAALLCVAALAPTSGCQAPERRTPHTGDTSGAGAEAAPFAAEDLQNAYERVIRDVLPSVVQIQSGKGLGSGIVYDDRGHVVTNAHVVGKGKTFRVTSASSGGTLTAKVVFAFPDQDLAVIKLDRMPGGLRPASFGNSSTVRVGQIVLAMGSPLGLASSVTQGIVSATGRTVTEGGSSSTQGGSGATIVDMVQTSAAINPGNSGGALVGLDGKVIGIPTLAAVDPDLNGSAAPGIGFAIPSHTVTTVANQIIRNGKVTNSGRAALGVTVRTVIGRNFQPEGVSVVQVKKHDAADNAGIKPGDVIIRLDKTKITSVTSLTEALGHHKPNDTVQVTLVRDGKQRTVQVTLSSM
jgi:putative serine protease PepD